MLIYVDICYVDMYIYIYMLCVLIHISNEFPAFLWFNGWFSFWENPEARNNGFYARM